MPGWVGQSLNDQEAEPSSLCAFTKFLKCPAYRVWQGAIDEKGAS